MDVVSRRPNQGWIEVITGSMFSGKSEELIRRLRRAQIARQRVQVFKPEFDDRFADDHIVSHSDIRLPSRSVPSARGAARGRGRGHARSSASTRGSSSTSSCRWSATRWRTAASA